VIHRRSCFASGGRADVQAAVKAVGGKGEAVYYAFGSDDVIIILCARDGKGGRSEEDRCNNNLELPEYRRQGEEPGPFRPLQRDTGDPNFQLSHTQKRPPTRYAF
jgi:hypothetical protein